MNKILTAALCFLITPFVNAYVLTFDDYTASTLYVGLEGSNYGGLAWGDGSNVLYTPNMPPNSGYVNGTISGDYVFFSDTPGYWTEISSIGNGLINWESAYFTGAWYNDLQIAIEGYEGNNLLYQQTITVQTTGPLLFEANWLGIDRVRFSSYGGYPAGVGGAGNYYAMDDFKFNGVPVPGTFALLGLGLFGLWSNRRAQKIGRSTR